MSTPSIEQLQRQAWAARQKKVAIARDSFGSFIEFVVRDDHGANLQLAMVHQQWLNHLTYCWQRNLHAIILAPFGHGKSSTLAVPLIARRLGQDPNTRIKIITNDDSGATKRVGAVKRILESPEYKGIYPAVQPGGKWTDHELYLKRPGHAIDPSVQARGIFTTGIGGRADLEVFDDVVDQKNSQDPNQRSKVLQFVEGTWLSRLEPDAKVLWIGTPWHLDDATHHLMQRPGWCSLVQRVTEDCQNIMQEVVGAVDLAYPWVGTDGFFLSVPPA